MRRSRGFAIWSLHNRNQRGRGTWHQNGVMRNWGKPALMVLLCGLALCVARAQEGARAAGDASASSGESFGMVLTEAFAASAPVVASDIPGYRDVVRDGRDGLLVAPGDALALAEALRRLA